VDPASIAWREDAFGGGGALRVRWLGTAGFELACEGHTLLIDPYLTRASLLRCLAGPLRSDPALVALHAPKADAIVLSHTHFDHALDAPAIARATGARVFGSRSAAALCRAEGVAAAQISEVELAGAGGPHEAEVGPFRLRFFPSAHSPLLFGRVPFPGDIADCDEVPLRAHRYRCGAVFGLEVRAAGRTLFHLGSAELLEQGLSGGPREVDLLLLCTAGWTTSRSLPERAMKALSPRAALLSHWDDFLRPLHKPARALPAMQMPRLVERLARASRDLRIGTLPLLGTVAV
jgi:L-ascorbate metabolism protein UlaG (beta-lactamase superfamily)